jgi:anti-sigma B factor antagonist
MSITHTDAGDVRKILITGRLDVDGTNSVASRLVELAQGPNKIVVVDLSTLKFLASIGIRALIASAKEVKARGGKMVLVANASSTVMMSIKATGVDQFVPVYGSAFEAEKAAAAA